MKKLEDYKIYRHGLPAVSVLVVSFSWAQASDKGALDKCLATKILADDHLAACSSIINAKSESGRSLAAALLGSARVEQAAAAQEVRWPAEKILPPEPGRKACWRRVYARNLSPTGKSISPQR